MNKYWVVHRDCHHAEEIFDMISNHLAEGWTLTGPIQVCPTQGNGGLYRHVATLVKDDPTKQQGSVVLLRGGRGGPRIVSLTPGTPIYLQEGEYLAAHPENEKTLVQSREAAPPIVPPIPPMLRKVIELQTIIAKLLEYEGAEGFDESIKKRAQDAIA